MHLFKNEMSKTNIKKLEEYLENILSEVEESGENENVRKN